MGGYNYDKWTDDQILDTMSGDDWFCLYQLRARAAKTDEERAGWVQKARERLTNPLSKKRKIWRLPFKILGLRPGVKLTYWKIKTYWLPFSIFGHKFGAKLSRWEKEFSWRM